ncbi:hypothetical protein ABVK25_010214 [Lepraria finkii]|uniref:Uncharacterized protein n=1 Tax=Lepraria finkii TaxID=1340010 RepID=A0ABR4AV20_9LECA
MKERVVDAVHPMSLHPLFLHLSLRNWRWYLNDVRQALLPIAEKATHSSLKIGEIDYDANFADSQRLAKWCENLTIVQSILDSDTDVGGAIQNHCAELRRIETSFAQQDAELLARVRLDLQRLKGFRRAATALLKQAEGTSQLLVKLLDYRKVDTLNAHVEELRSLAITSSLQGESLRNLTEKTRYDSRYMRILTFMAVAYLPASLLAAILSANLVYVPSPAAETHSGPLIVRRALWIYSLASLALTAVTLGCVAAWARRSEGFHLPGNVRRRN